MWSNQSTPEYLDKRAEMTADATAPSTPLKAISRLCDSRGWDGTSTTRLTKRMLVNVGAPSSRAFGRHEPGADGGGNEQERDERGGRRADEKIKLVPVL
jgi:hypothetical protein